MQSTEGPTMVGADHGDPAGPPPRGSAYAELSRRIKRAGLMDGRPGYYTAHIAATVTLCAAGVAAFLLIGDSWWQLAVAAYFAVISTQLGFLGHDAGHLALALVLVVTLIVRPHHASLAAKDAR
jgi:hypothetical protein